MPRSFLAFATVFTLVGCNAPVEPERTHVYAVFPFMIAPERRTMPIGEWVGGPNPENSFNHLNPDPVAVYCGTVSYCRQLEAEGWFLVPDSIAEPLISYQESCPETDCVTTEMTLHFWDHERLSYRQWDPRDRSRWAYEAIACGEAFVGHRLHAKTGPHGTIVYPHHPAFADTMWVDIEGC